MVQLLVIPVWARADSPRSTAPRAGSSLLELTLPSSLLQLLLVALPIRISILATLDQVAVSVCCWAYLP
jgi:hypothetical protein